MVFNIYGKDWIKVKFAVKWRSFNGAGDPERDEEAADRKLKLCV